MGGMKSAKSFDSQVKALRRALSHFPDRNAQKLVNGGVKKALKVLEKGIADKAPPEFEAIRELIGSRLAKRVGGDFRISGKVGVGVGAGAKAQPKRKSGGGGVGIGPKNVHWFILGTEQRTTKSGKSTGQMPPQVPDMVSRGVAENWNKALAAMTSYIRENIAAESAKIRAEIEAAR